MKIILGCCALLVLFGVAANAQNSPGGVNVLNGVPAGQNVMAGSLPVAVATDQPPLTIVSNSNVTPQNCSGTITTGGTAQTAFANANMHGFIIANLSTDTLWISFTGTAAANTPGSYPLIPLSASGAGTFAAPLGFGINTNISIIGATTGDAFSCTYY